MRPEATQLTAAEMRVGRVAEFSRQIALADVEAFAAVSGDFNPAHVDQAFAAATYLRRPVVHGAFQVGLASQMIGMHLPGKGVTLGLIHAKFPAPLFYPCVVTVRGEITAWQPDDSSGSIRVQVFDQSSSSPTADISMAFTYGFSTGRSAPRERAESARTPIGDRRAVLVTGASGGIGQDLVASLAQRFEVLALVNERPLRPEIEKLPGVRVVRANIQDSDAMSAAVSAALGSAPLFGIVHAAWPMVARGGLLDVAPETIELQLQFGTTHLVRLAALLKATAARDGRLIALGSTAGFEKPVLQMAPYSLGKAALEQTVRLLAAELGSRNITVNAVAPSLVPVGMNGHLGKQQQLRAESAVPLGRLCHADDIAGAVEFLLSESGGFVSGQTISLTGGQL